MGRFQSGQMGQTVNLLRHRFGGSNPSLPTPHCGSSSVDRASAFQAEGRGFESRLPLNNDVQCLCSSGVEHFLGKEEVAGSNPAIGSKFYSTTLRLSPMAGSTMTRLTGAKSDM